MKKVMPNKGTYTMGSANGEKPQSTTQVMKGKDLRSKPCQNKGKS
jgi:hypothetical protein